MTPDILAQTQKIYPKDGIYQTYIKEVKFLKTSEARPKEPLLYDLSLIVVLQGKKILDISGTSFQYDTNNYLVVPATLPYECETFASLDEPLQVLAISLDKKVLFELIDSLKMQPPHKNQHELALFCDETTEEIKEIVLRIVKTMGNEKESKILGKSLLRELYYRILLGKNALFLYKMFLENNTEAKISKALQMIHDNLNQNLDIPNLAKHEAMSVSSFHTHFKKITSYTPLQYIKKLRLTKARDLISIYRYGVSDATSEIGYIDVSQFSKDFKRYFGFSPNEAKPAA
jgi:AraC-like DNA-binding protein